MSQSESGAAAGFCILVGWIGLPAGIGSATNAAIGWTVFFGITLLLGCLDVVLIDMQKRSMQK